MVRKAAAIVEAPVDPTDAVVDAPAAPPVVVAVDRAVFAGSIAHSDFTRALAIVGKSVSTKTTLPVLNNILVEFQTGNVPEDGRLRLSATNLEVSTTLYIPAVVEEAGQITLPAKLLTDFMASVDVTPGETVTLSCDKFFTTSVRCGRYAANIKGIDPQDFPHLPGITETNFFYTLTLDAAALGDAIRSVAVAASTDETRPVLTGVQLSVQGEYVTFAAADAFRLSIRKVLLDEERGQEQPVIIPARALHQLAGMLPKTVKGGSAPQVAIKVTNNRSQVLFTWGDGAALFSSSTIEGTFPNFAAIIPKQYTTRVVIDTSALAGLVKVASLFAKEGGNIVKLAFTAGQDLTPAEVRVVAKAEIADGASAMDVTMEGADQQIAFNSKYLADALSVVATSQVVLELQDSTKPGVLHNLGDDTFTHVIMPMHLSNR